MNEIRKAVFASLVVLGSSPVWADGDTHQDPSSSGSIGLIAVPRASTIGSKRVGFGVFFESVSREEGSSSIERGGITAVLGLGDRFELFTSVEPKLGVRRQYRVEDAFGLSHFNAPRLNDHPLATDTWSDSFGHIRLGGKYRFLGDPDSYTGMALQAAVKFPTANEDDGVGTGKLDFGADLIASAELGEVVGFNGRLGLMFRGDPDLFEVANELHWGIGAEVPTRFWLHAIIEFYGVSYMGKPDALLSPIGFENYTILQGGLRLTFENGIALTGGINRNLSYDDRFELKPDKVGTFFQLSYAPRPHYVDAPPPVNHAPTISCHAEATTVRKGESVRLSAEARDSDGDTVTIEWSAGQGSLTPSRGGSVNWSSAGASGGTVVITATASDGRGERATCEVRIRIEEPPAKVVTTATVRHLACDEFAARSARLDNRCKAVLDDVSVQLRANPRATLAIHGHGDGGDGNAAQVARQRAENAREYLSRNHGIDGGRMSVDSSASGGPRVDLEISIP